MEKIQDVLVAAGNAYKLIMENEKVRVLDIILKPGAKAPMHNHPGNHVVYVMKDSRFKLTFPDGAVKEVDLKAGQALWMEAGSHSTENIGTGEGHNLVVELKN